MPPPGIFVATTLSCFLELTVDLLSRLITPSLYPCGAIDLWIANRPNRSKAVPILHRTRGTAGRRAKALDQSLGAVKYSQAILDVLQAGEICFGRVGAQRALRFP